MSSSITHSCGAPPPIALFAYRRLSHVRRTVEALQMNHGSLGHDLIIFSDGPRSPAEQSSIDEVREYLQNISGFRSIIIHNRSENLGLSRSIIDGVSKVLMIYESIIVLEDDIVTSPHFLTYMNSALDRFRQDERIISIHGYTYPVDNLPDAFFLPGADCWGWATWRRGWKLFNQSGQALFDELEKRNLLKDFDYNGTYPYSKMLQKQIKGENDSWAIRWYASAFLAGKLTLYPGRSLVQNIGTDSSGTHCRRSSIFDVELSYNSIDLDVITIEPSLQARMAFERFFRRSRSSIIKKLYFRIKEIFIMGTR